MLAQAVDFDNLENIAAPAFGPLATLGSIITELLPYIFVIAGIMLFLYLLYGGFHLMISRGEPKVIQEAKGKITNALLGFVVLLVAYWVVRLFAVLFDIPILKDIFK